MKFIKVFLLSIIIQANALANSSIIKLTASQCGFFQEIIGLASMEYDLSDRPEIDFAAFNPQSCIYDITADGDAYITTLQKKLKPLKRLKVESDELGLLKSAKKEAIFVNKSQAYSVMSALQAYTYKNFHFNKGKFVGDAKVSYKKQGFQSPQSGGLLKKTYESFSVYELKGFRCFASSGPSYSIGDFCLLLKSI